MPTPFFLSQDGGGQANAILLADFPGEESVAIAAWLATRVFARDKEIERERIVAICDCDFWCFQAWTGVGGEVGAECRGNAKPVEVQCKQH